MTYIIRDREEFRTGIQPCFHWGLALLSSDFQAVLPRTQKYCWCPPQQAPSMRDFSVISNLCQECQIGFELAKQKRQFIRMIPMTCICTLLSMVKATWMPCSRHKHGGFCWCTISSTAQTCTQDAIPICADHNQPEHMNICLFHFTIMTSRSSAESATQARCPWQQLCCTTSRWCSPHACSVKKLDLLKE